VTPFDCFYYPPPQLAADGYKVLNSAWTPLYIAGGKGQSPELIYKWNPYLLGEFPGHLSWWTIPKEHRAQVVGVKMSVWQTSAEDTLCSLSTRLPAMSDRSWHPEAGRSYADYQGRVSTATTLLGKLLAGVPAETLGHPPPVSLSPPPPSSLPGPAAPNFVGEAGACRDADGNDGTRLEANGYKGTVMQCAQSCITLGNKLDAYDWGFVLEKGTQQGVWCGCWGTTFTPADNTTINGVSFTYANGGSVHPVCHGNSGDNNFCYHRATIACNGGGGGGGGGCLPGCTCGL
jgi:hypothetical protein